MRSSDRDPVLASLARQIEGAQGSIIWIAEEQESSLLLNRNLKKHHATYLSNRIDQVEAMQSNGVQAEFHDFEASLLRGRSFANIFIRVPKQRALIHHLINLVPEIVKPKGKLWIAGLKGEGIKTHVQRAEQRLGAKATKIRSSNGVGLYSLEYGIAGPLLRDESYSQLRRIEMATGTSYWSKPGIYGWNKVDEGSRLLLDVMSRMYPDLSGKRVLDLGCGYGVLAVGAVQAGPTRLVVTDNQAGSVRAAEANLKESKCDVQVLASDCGSSIDEKFDLILCNPPFHQGFGVTQDLHAKFIASIARLMAPGGSALMVINSFLRLDQLCAEQHLQVLNSWEFQEAHFTVLELSNRGRVKVD